MVRGMYQAGTVESFIQSIQPVLMNDCMTSGCRTAHRNIASHGFGPHKARRNSPRHATEPLRHAAMDRPKNPDDSPLLKAPRGPHGNVPTALFTDSQLGQYRRLSEWVYRVAEQPMPAEGASGLGRIVLRPATCGFGDLAPPRKLPARPGHSQPMPPAHRPGGGNPVQQASGTVQMGPRNPDAFDLQRFRRRGGGPPDAPHAGRQVRF